MNIFKHTIPYSVYGLTVQWDLCHEEIGYWWPGLSLLIHIGKRVFVIAKTQEEM